jgi:hypothetical protein
MAEVFRIFLTCPYWWESILKQATFISVRIFINLHYPLPFYSLLFNFPQYFQANAGTATETSYPLPAFESFSILIHNR